MLMSKSYKLDFAGNKISTQTGIGTAIAIAGVAIYSYFKAKMEEEKQVSPKVSFELKYQLDDSTFFKEQIKFLLTFHSTL